MSTPKEEQNNREALTPEYERIEGLRESLIRSTVMALRQEETRLYVHDAVYGWQELPRSSRCF